jgi:alpha-amylase/alpha-mannosidase (GH57 family)
VPHLVVHGHLYQPPRENPWTETIDRQPSAAPLHDWNQRVSEECYERWGSSIVRAPDGRANSLVNLFSRLSFNIGPTLASWLAQQRPEVMAAALQGDLDAIARRGTGSALMQPYGHPIMPLCTTRERRLQLSWGAADFERRFGRRAEGIWLSECAVDRATLEDCAQFGLRFTIVAPEQIAKVRPLAGGEWVDPASAPKALLQPLLVKLPSGGTFTVFVFHGALSRSVAFSGLLDRTGERFLEELDRTVGADVDPESCVLIAADGETFGHHQPDGEESLAAALQRARLSGRYSVTHLADVLRSVTPRYEAQLVEPSSWSCSHGVGRWSQDCGCGVRGHEAWSHAWREPLRRAASQLRDRVFALVDRRGKELLRDPWGTLEQYGPVLVDPAGSERLEEFLIEHAPSGLDTAGRARAAALLELVRQTLFSSTSCGWFFDDIGGIEAIQVMRHAARACELCRLVFGIDPEPDLRTALATARSNRLDAGHGESIYLSEALAARPSTASLALWYGALRGTQQAWPAPGYVVSERATPRVTATKTAASHEIDLEIVSVRSRERAQHTLRIELDTSGLPHALHVDGRPLAPTDRHAFEAWIEYRAEALSTGWPEPSTALRQALRELVRDLEQQPGVLPSPLSDVARTQAARELLLACSRELDLELLADALALAAHVGFTAEQQLHLLAPVANRLREWLEQDLAAPSDQPKPDLAAVLLHAREALGERVLVPIWKRLIGANPPVRRSECERWAEAAGLSPDALTPLDTPARPIRPEVPDSLA